MRTYRTILSYTNLIHLMLFQAWGKLQTSSKRKDMYSLPQVLTLQYPCIFSKDGMVGCGKREGKMSPECEQLGKIVRFVQWAVSHLNRNLTRRKYKKNRKKIVKLSAKACFLLLLSSSISTQTFWHLQTPLGQSFILHPNTDRCSFSTTS